MVDGRFSHGETNPEEEIVMCRSFIPEARDFTPTVVPQALGVKKRQQLLATVDRFERGLITRRGFVQGASSLVGAGAASVLLAACSETVPEPPAAPEGVGSEGDEEASATGLTTSMVEYGEHDQQTLQGHLALPASGPAPAVLVIQEWWGLNPHIKDVANRVARAGYVALAPDLYHGEVATEPTEARKLAMALDQATALAELDVAARYLLDLESTRGTQVGIMGFCLGGRNRPGLCGPQSAECRGRFLLRHTFVG